MKGHQFISSKGQCVCSIRISGHALERFNAALTGAAEITEQRARGFLGRAELLKLTEVHALGYRPRAHGRLVEGQTSHYLRIQHEGQEALAVLTDDPGDGRLIWVTTYGLDQVTDVRRTIRQHRMGRKAVRKFMDRKRGD